MAGKRSMRLSSTRISLGDSAKRNAKTASQPQSDQSSDYGDDNLPSDTEASRSSKRRKLTKGKANRALDFLFRQDGDVIATIQDSCSPAGGRQHSLAYHKPLFLCQTRGRENRQALLSWFDSISTKRAMPWRKTWINPAHESDATKLREALERRAYQVWISEIMLQQTRVAVVIDYWNRWMDKWPTIHDLASADPEDVLAAWRGLGYYSRATRIHEASKLVVQDSTMRGLLPSMTTELEAKVPGVGRYTAGAISAIVFGRAAPMVDGNVLRVLSRQLGIYGNIKTDKAVIDTIWAAADAFVKAVAQDRPSNEEGDDEVEVSDRPGRWGQALMELGSTICTPKPDCAECPITASCRVYGEAKMLGANVEKKPNGSLITDIEDLCTLCEPFGEEDDEDDTDLTNALKESKANAKLGPPAKKNQPKQMTLSAFSFTSAKSASKPASTETSKREDAQQQEITAAYARKFPIKTVKKPVRQEETIVCAIRHPDGSYLLHRRPEKGLLAGLWEFPSKVLDLSDGNGSATAQKRKHLAMTHVASTVGDDGALPKHAGELGSVPWLFSHLKLTMHVHLFQLAGDATCPSPIDGSQEARWSSDVEGESMGTGMRKCWALVRDAEA